MIWALVACAATLCAYSGAHAQPLTCKSDEQCEAGLYCDRDAAYVCRRCLDCEQLKRYAPPLPSHCIKSVTECGTCIAGLVEDLRRDSECVPPSDDAAIPAYVWVIVSVVSLLLLAVVVFIVTYVLRNTYTFKILASTRASVQSPCGAVGAGAGAGGAGAGAGGGASAPDPPPPYHAHYSAVRATSPPPDHHDDAHHGEESSWPFIKRTPSGHETGGGARESAGSQAARVYSNPHYVRGAPQLPPSYDSMGAGSVGASVGDDEREAFAHDEDTMESVWRPGGDGADAASGAASNLSAQLDEARGSALVRAPHAVPPCAWQDSNNNRNASEAERGAASSSGAPAYIINVVQTIHTAQPPPRHHEPGC